MSSIGEPISAQVLNPRARRRRIIRKRFLRRPMAVGGLIVVLSLVAVAIFAPWIAPHTFSFNDFNHVNAKPSSKYLLGTDELGHD